MFNKKLREIRMSKGLTQPVVADNLDITLRGYQHYEAGTREPPLQTLVRIADFLNVTTDELLGRNSANLDKIHKK